MGSPALAPAVRIFLFVTVCGCLVASVAAENGTITISYRGLGAGYIGDTFILDGTDTIGNMTILKVTGAGLPADGVPPADLNAASGTGTPVSVGADGRWKFSWYTATIPGAGKLVSSRYTLIASDAADPSRTAMIVIQLRKPEYSIIASPNPSHYGDYIQLIGVAETGITSAKIEIRDTSGTVLHTFTSPVSSSGYLSYGFHSDLRPGQYTVTVSNPALKVPFGTIMTVVSEEVFATITTSAPAGIPPVIPTMAPVSPATPLPTTRRPSLAADPLTVAAGLACAGIILLTAGRK